MPAQHLFGLQPPLERGTDRVPRWLLSFQNRRYRQYRRLLHLNQSPQFPLQQPPPFQLEAQH